MVKFVYTLSSVSKLPEYAQLSVKSLLQYADAEDIVVFFTPPRNQEDINAFERLGVDLRLVEPRTEPFAAFSSKSYYGAKTWLCTVDESSVVFLDCDTFVLDDLREICKGDFDVKARPGTTKVKQPEWRQMFNRFEQPYLDWMPNAGVLVFKNGAHQAIEKDWLHYLGQDLGYRHNANHKEQYALALAIGGYNVEKMSQHEHVMLWEDEFPPNGVIYHTGKSLNPDTSPIEILKQGARGKINNYLR